MATKLVTISGTSWVALTTAGQSGACWLATNVLGQESVVVDHSTISGTDCDPRKSYSLFRDYSSGLTFTADNMNDVYYARCTDNGAWAIVAVDAY